MSEIMTRLEERRRSVFLEAQHILDTAEKHKRALSSGEQARYDAMSADLEELDQRITEVRTEADRQSAADVIRAKFDGKATVPDSGRGDAWLADAFRSMLIDGNPKPITLRADGPSVFQPGPERRDLVTTTPANFRPTSVFRQVWEHATETSGVLRAGATVWTTETGETLHVPRSTALSTAAIVAEAAAISESDPTLSTLALGSNKYGVLVQLSTELLTDSTVDLAGYIARETGQAIGVALGNHIVNGTGTNQPRGILADTSAGKTGPTGTSTTFGTQATAGQGTDLLNDLYSSLLEPYTASKATAFVARNSTIGLIRNLKTSAGETVGTGWLATSPAPWYPDPSVPAPAANAKSVLAGDFSRYIVRLAGGLRFERSDDFAFDRDLVTFRCLLRADGGLVNTDAIKHFAHSAT